ncbi:hypothetical protein ACUIAJ_00820 [Dermabacteraceae bacterium CCM 9519]
MPNDSKEISLSEINKKIKDPINICITTPLLASFLLWAFTHLPGPGIPYFDIVNGLAALSGEPSNSGAGLLIIPLVAVILGTWGTSNISHKFIMKVRLEQLLLIILAATSVQIMATGFLILTEVSPPPRAPLSQLTGGRGVYEYTGKLFTGILLSWTTLLVIEHFKNFTGRDTSIQVAEGAWILKRLHQLDKAIPENYTSPNKLHLSKMSTLPSIPLGAMLILATFFMSAIAVTLSHIYPEYREFVLNVITRLYLGYILLFFLGLWWGRIIPSVTSLGKIEVALYTLVLAPIVPNLIESGSSTQLLIIIMTLEFLVIPRMLHRGILGLVYKVKYKSFYTPPLLLQGHIAREYRELKRELQKGLDKVALRTARLRCKIQKENAKLDRDRQRLKEFTERLGIPGKIDRLEELYQRMTSLEGGTGANVESERAKLIEDARVLKDELDRDEERIERKTNEVVKKRKNRIDRMGRELEGLMKCLKREKQKNKDAQNLLED